MEWIDDSIGCVGNGIADDWVMMLRARLIAKCSRVPRPKIIEVFASRDQPFWSHSNPRLHGSPGSEPPPRIGNFHAFVEFAVICGPKQT